MRATAQYLQSGYNASGGGALGISSEWLAANAVCTAGNKHINIRELPPEIYAGVIQANEEIEQFKIIKKKCL